MAVPHARSARPPGAPGRPRRRRAARELLAGVVDDHAAGGLAGPERAVRRPGGPEVREPAAHGVVQDPRRVHADRPARRGAAGARGRRGQRRQPRTGRGARRRDARRHGDGVHARAGGAAEGRPRPAATGRPCTWSARPSTRASSHARAFAERTGAVLVHPFDHVDVIAGQGTVGLEIVEQCPDVATVLVPAGGGGLLGGDRRGRPGRGAGGRRAGGGRGRLAALAGRGRADRAAADAHDGRRHRGGLSGRRHVRAGRTRWSTRS